MSRPIYLDYAATTPVDERAAQQMLTYLTREGAFGNPASRSHAYGWQAQQAVDTARRQVAELINAEASEIVWTSGATEANNLALKGAAHFYRSRGGHIVTCKTEHKSVLDSCRHLEQEGVAVTYLTPDPGGLLNLDKLAQALRPDTILVSLMHVNNETGVIQDIAAVGALTRARGILLHVDAAQSAGKVPIDVQHMQADLLSLAAHKVYGPKGIGALYVRRQPPVGLTPQMHGGGQERGLRSGTLAVHQIVGMGEAFRIAREEMAVESARIGALRDRLQAGLLALEEVRLNGDPARRVPHNLNISFNYVDGEALLMALKDLAVSSGSACTSESGESSHVLRALGLSEDQAQSALRFSLGRYTTAEEIDRAIELVTDKVRRLRALSPLWEMRQPVSQG